MHCGLIANCLSDFRDARQIVNSGDVFDDSVARNAWKWIWLEKKVENMDKLLSENIRKVNVVGTGGFSDSDCCLNGNYVSRVMMD